MNKIFKLQFYDEIRIVNPAPHTIEDLRRKAQELFGVIEPVFTYQDNEKQIITVDSPEEYREITKIRKKTININTLEKADLKRKRQLCRMHYKYLQPAEYIPQNNGELIRNSPEIIPQTRVIRSSATNPIKIEDSEEDMPNQADYAIAPAPKMCKLCQQMIDDENLGINCEGCNDFYELECLEYRRKPQGDWYCEDCALLMLSEEEQELRRKIIKRAKRAQYARK